MKNVILEYILNNIQTQCPKCGQQFKINTTTRYIKCGCGCEIVLPEYSTSLHLVGIAKENK